MSEKIELDFTEIEKILKKSEEELEELKDLEQKDKNLMESLRIRRATIETKKRHAGDVSDVAKFFEKRKSIGFSYADQKLADDIQAEKEELKKNEEKSVVELVFEEKLMKAKRLRNVEIEIPQILNYMDEDEKPSKFKDHITKGLEPYCDPKSDITFAVINNLTQQTYMYFDTKEKFPVNLFIVEGPKTPMLYIFSNQMVNITSVAIENIEAFVMKLNDSQIFSLTIGEEKSIMFQSTLRSQLLIHLISCFEKYKLRKFKIYQCKQISSKQELVTQEIALGTFENSVGM